MELLYEDERLHLSCHRNLIFAVWKDAPQIEQMKAYRSGIENVLAANPKGIAGFSVVVSGTPVFSSEVRAEVAQLTRDDLLALGLAHVVLVRGLVGAAVRAFLSTAMLLARGKQATKVFDDITGATAWIAERMEDAGLPWEADGASGLAALCDQAVEEAGISPGA